MRILILGGTGFIGRRILHALDGHDLVVLHRGRTPSAHPGVRYLRGRREDLASDRLGLAQLRFDVVLDMIPRNEFDARVAINALRRVSPRLVAISSVSVYRSFGILMRTEEGEIDPHPCAEDAPLRSRFYPYRGIRPRSKDDPRRWLDDYDKILAERVFLDQSELAPVILRLPLVYGPGDPDGRVRYYLRRMADGAGPIYLQESVARWRNARAFVDNVASAVSLLVLNETRHQVYNVAELQDFAERDWVGLIGERAGWAGSIVEVADREAIGCPSIPEIPNDARFAQHLRMDSSRIREEFGYREAISLGEALDHTIRAERRK